MTPTYTYIFIFLFLRVTIITRVSEQYLWPRIVVQCVYTQKTIVKTCHTRRRPGTVVHKLLRITIRALKEANITPNINVNKSNNGLF